MVFRIQYFCIFSCSAFDDERCWIFFFRRVFFLGSSRVAFEGTATSCTHQSPCRPTRCKTQHFDDEVVGPGYFGMIWIVLATRPLFLAYSKLLDHSQCFSFIGIVFANG